MLEQLIFGSGVTLKTVYNSCSFGKLAMTPYQGSGVMNGVAEVFFNGVVAGQNPQAVENILIDQIRNSYLMIMMPPGTQNSWLAISYIGYYRFVFNNDWSGYVSAAVHEIGHTLGLQHRSRSGNEYNDQTGYMGYSYAAVGSPSKCFDGHKNFLLGWYSDRTLEIVPSALPWTGDLVPFVDYDKARNDEPVVIKVNDLFLQYNRAKLFNYQTRQNIDEVTITQGTNASSLSKAVGSVSMSNTTFTLLNYQGSNTWLIEACTRQSISDNKRADLYHLSIHLATQESGCITSTLPTIMKATPPPVPSTTAPTTATATPTTLPSRKTRSPRRTVAPITSPTSSPRQPQNSTSAPTLGIVVKCMDISSGTFRYKASSRSCQWLSVRPSEQRVVCAVPGTLAYSLCKATCKSC